MRSSIGLGAASGCPIVYTAQARTLVVQRMAARLLQVGWRVPHGVIIREHIPIGFSGYSKSTTYLVMKIPKFFNVAAEGIRALGC